MKDKQETFKVKLKAAFVQLYIWGSLKAKRRELGSALV